MTVINMCNVTGAATIYLLIYGNDTEFADLTASVVLDPGVVMIHPFTVSLFELIEDNQPRSATVLAWMG